MPEVLNSSGVTLGAGINWLFVIVISVITPTMADNLNEWMFYFFAIFNVIVSCKANLRADSSLSSSSLRAKDARNSN